MNTKQGRGTGLAGRAVLATFVATGSFTAAQAAEPAADPVAELTQPHSVVEIGVGNVSDDSFKFGEYNGLQEQGTYGVGGLDLAGGGAYDSEDTTRWRLRGTDLGLETRNVLGEYGQQGRFRLTLGYDGLRRNRSDSYSTPYLGAGGNVLTLPSNWIVPVVPRLSATAPNARGLSSTVAAASGIVSGVSGAPTAPQLATSAALIAADLPAFAGYDLYTTRKRMDAGVSAWLSPKWEFAVSARRENRDGAKPMGSVTRASGGDISTILADPIDQRTDQVSATLGYRTKGNFLQFAYYASKFQNDVASVTWQNWALPTASATMSSAPSNQLHQFSLSGGHDFSAATRLVASASYARNTQDGSFLTDPSTVLVPVPSLDQKVVTTAFNAKLTSRPSDTLRLGLSYKYDLRDNQTPVYIFGYYDANEPAGAANINTAFAAALGVPATQLRSNTNVNANRPHSRRVNQAIADADLKVGARQALKAAYEWEKLERWCEGTWYNCSEAPDSTEQTVRVEWRAQPSDTINARLGYAWSDRNVKRYDENAFLALVPLANVSPSTATGGATAYSFMLANGWTGWGPVAGLAATTGNLNLFFPLNSALANATYSNQNRISELLGMRRYNGADRRRDKAVAAFDWQAMETMSLAANVEYSDDAYDRSIYGLLGSRDFAANLEANWSPTATLAITAFYTRENLKARSAGNTYTANSAAANVNGFTAISGGCYATIALRNANNKIDPCLNWFTDRRDKTNLYGLTVNRTGLLGSKLDLGATLVVTRARSDNFVAGGNYVNNPLAVAGAPANTIAAFYIPAAPLPQVTTDTTELRLKASYALSSASTLRLYYTYGHLQGEDYAYEGMQFGGLAGVLPSLETAPDYTVQVVALTYSHRF